MNNAQEQKNGYLIPPFSGSITETIQKLESAYSSISKQALKSLQGFSPKNQADWISEFKGHSVPLEGAGKSEEKLGEIVNQLPTIRRAIDFLLWTQTSSNPLAKHHVKSMHATNSGDSSDNDIILESPDKLSLVRVEAFDISGDHNARAKIKGEVDKLREQMKDSKTSHAYFAASKNPWKKDTSYIEEVGSHSNTVILKMKTEQ